MGMSKQGTIKTSVPLRFLSAFWKIDAWVPQRSLYTVSGTLKPDKAILLQVLRFYVIKGVKY